MCISWAAREPWVAAVTRAAEWVGAGQVLGPLDSVAPVIADGVMTVRREWDTVRAEDHPRP